MIVRCGNSSKFWNTIPTRARSLGRFVFGSLTWVPSTTMSPFWNGSSALTTLISVDLPEPEGPHTTITSPFSTLVVQLVSTWNAPYHLETSLISIIDMVADSAGFRSTDDGDLLLQLLHQERTPEADDEVDECGEQVHLDQAADRAARPSMRRRGSR